jgi:hypothetical protein
MAAGGTDLLHLKRLTWDAIEAQTPPTAARLAEELAVSVKSVCEWLDGESKPADAQVLAMIKMTRASEQQRPSEARTGGRPERPPSTEGEVPGDEPSR